jgi:hypothetical protein
MQDEKYQPDSALWAADTVVVVVKVGDWEVFILPIDVLSSTARFQAYACVEAREGGEGIFQITDDVVTVARPNVRLAIHGVSLVDDDIHGDLFDVGRDVYEQIARLADLDEHEDQEMEKAAQQAPINHADVYGDSDDAEDDDEHEGQQVAQVAQQESINHADVCSDSEDAEDWQIECCHEQGCSHIQDVIACDKCQKWYHFECVRLSKEDVRTMILSWSCPNCPMMNSYGRKINPPKRG